MDVSIYKLPFVLVARRDGFFAIGILFFLTGICKKKQKSRKLKEKARIKISLSFLKHTPTSRKNKRKF